MRFARLAWLVPAVACLLPDALRAEEPLVPEGENVEVLDGAQWAPLVGIRGLAASTDGTFFATVSDDGVLRLWDAASGAEMRRFPAAASGQIAVALSGDNKVVVAAGSDGSLQIWDVTTGRNLQNREPDGSPVSALAISADGRMVAFGGPRRAPDLWRYESDKDAVPLSDVRDSRGLAFGQGGRLLAATSADHSVVLVDTALGKPSKVLSDGSSAFGPVAFSSDGRSLAVGTESGLVEVFDLTTGQPRTLEASAQALMSVSYAFIGGQAAGEMLLTAALDGGVRIWNASTFALIRRLPADEHCCTAVGVAPAHGIVGASLTNIPRWDVASGTALPPLSSQASAVVGVSSAGDGPRIVAVASADGSARVVEGETGKVIREVHGVVGGAIALSPDENTLAYADADHVVHFLDIAAGHDTATTGPLEGRVGMLAFSANGRHLAGTVADNGVQIWDPANGHRMFQLDAKKEVNALSWSAKGATLITARGASFTLWSGEKGTSIRRIGVDSTVTSVAVSADGEKAVAAEDDGSIHVFAASGTETAVLLGHPPGKTRVVITRDAQTVISGSHDGTVRFWDLREKSQRGQLDGHVGGVTCLALSADASAVLAGTGDGAVRLWATIDHSPMGLLRYGPGGWLSLRNGHVLRGDDGRFLLHPDDSGLLAGRLPVSLGNPKLSAEVLGVKSPGQGSHLGEIKLKITNEAGGGRAYWVSAEIERPKGTQPLDGLSLVNPPVVQRIEPGASVTVALPVSFLSSGTPGPQDLQVPVLVTHAYGKIAVINVPLHVSSANLKVQLITMDGPRNAPVARLEVTNNGDDPSGPLTVTPTFFEKGKEVSTLPVVQLESLAPHASESLGVAGPAAVMERGAEIHLTVSGAYWPTYKWALTVALHRPLPWGLIFLFLLIAAGIAAGAYAVRVSRNPIVLAVSRDPNELYRYPLSDLKSVQWALMRARRLGGALTAARIPEARWQRAVAATEGAEAAANAMAEALGAKRQEQPIGGHSAWGVTLPEMQIRFPRQTALVVMVGRGVEAGQATALANALHTSGEGVTVAVAVDLTEDQSARETLQNVPRMSFVVVSAAKFRDILLAEHAIEHLQTIIAEQRPLSELSPYQGSGGVELEQLFFGREKELRAMTDRVQRSFLVVAPRQMGKSSLLKAVQRRLASRTDVEVHLITLSDDDLTARVARQLNRPRPDTSDAFLEVAAGTKRKPRVWLIDEADAFIARDARNRYPISQAMRTLSEEGRAYFILSGFWHLYAAAYLSTANPLRNFGEVIRLEPLDREAALGLATKPMAALGITYESQELVDKILNETACRAHLIVSACRGMIDRLGPSERILTEANVNQGLYQNTMITNEFKYWRREPLGRALVRLVLLYGPMTRAVLRETLAEQGLEVANELFQSTLDRLDLGFILTAAEDGKLHCPVPLMRRYIESEDSLETSLRRDIDDFLGIQVEGGPPPGSGPAGGTMTALSPVLPTGTMTGISPVLANGTMTGISPIIPSRPPQAPVEKKEGEGEEQEEPKTIIHRR
jgi:WD40 repeat protein